MVPYDLPIAIKTIYPLKSKFPCPLKNYTLNIEYCEFLTDYEINPLECYSNCNYSDWINWYNQLGPNETTKCEQIKKLYSLYVDYDIKEKLIHIQLYNTSVDSKEWIIKDTFCKSNNIILLASTLHTQRKACNHSLKKELSPVEDIRACLINEINKGTNILVLYCIPAVLIDQLQINKLTSCSIRNLSGYSI